MHPVILAIIEQLERELSTAALACEQAHASATHSENKPENKYDTLAIEAAYLAHGQSERIAELQANIQLYRKFNKPTFEPHTRITVGAIVRLMNVADESIKLIFIGPVAGGLKVTVDDEIIQIVTPTAPLGKQLLSLQPDDEVCLITGKKKQVFEILEVR